MNKEFFYHTGVSIDHRGSDGMRKRRSLDHREGLSASRSHGSLHHNSRQVEGESRYRPKQQALNQRKKNEAEDQTEEF